MRRPHLLGPDRFGLLLALLLALFVLLPMVQERRLGALLNGLLVFAVLLVALAACAVERRRILLVAGGCAVGSVAVAVGTAAGDDPVDEWMTALFAAVLFATMVLVLRRIMQHRRVTYRTVAGALCTYLLVGMAFGSLFRTVSGVDADSFTVDLANDSTYFSFVTLTTLGYGDIAPVSDLARSMTTLEAVMGQILLVTLVARFVGLLGETREPRRRRGTGDGAPAVEARAPSGDDG